MITIPTSLPYGVSRRKTLAGIGALGLGLGQLSLALAQKRTGSQAVIPTTLSRAGFGRARSVLLIYTSGGQSQLELWDPKPTAPQQIRGEFQTIPSSVPGVFLGEHLPRVAQLAHRFCIVRSMSHDDLDHGSASYLTLTGQFHPIKSSNPPPRPTDMPVHGAILNRLVRPTDFPYNAIHVNGPVLVPTIPAPGQDAGFLGRDFEPLVLGDLTRGEVAIPCLDAWPDLNNKRHDARRSLLAQLDSVSKDGADHKQRHPGATSRRLEESTILYRQAYEMLNAPRCREAFRLDSEPDSVRSAYGFHRPGQACLMGRRLVEAGVPLVTVMWNHNIRGQDVAPSETEEYGWDTHNDIYEALKVHLLPRFDQSFSTLLSDLHDRGLLEQTLVICMGEFGRAPLVALERNFAGSTPGRKHWASVYSLVVAGAGTVAGATYGSSDKIAAQPVSHRTSPADIAATIFWALGIDPAGHYQDAVSRPYPISTGQPIIGLWGEA